MPTIRVRQGGGLPLPADTSYEGQIAVQTAEERQYKYLRSAYVNRHYDSAGLPGAVRSSLRRIATKARYDPSKRGPDGLPLWERGTVLVPKTNWRRIVGGVLVMLASDGKPGTASYRCYVPLLIEKKRLDSLDEGRPLYLLISPKGD